MKKLKVAKNFLLGKAITIIGLGMIAAPSIANSPPANAFWKVQDGKLLDPNGNPFVFRGVTINHSLAPQKTIQALKDAAAMGANSAQIEFAMWVNETWPRPIVAELREIIQACKDNKLVCVLEPNDGSGYSQAYGSRSPSLMASYWAFNDLREVLLGSHQHIILGLSNQLVDSNYSASEYVARMQSYLYEFRSSVSGFMMMIDGNKWGQDGDKAMLQLATSNLQSGSGYSNIIYSVDMFDAYQDPASVRDYMASFAELGAPLLVGGFGPVPYYHPHNQTRPSVSITLQPQTVMQYAEEFGVGYFGWSWSGNENAALDVVTDWNANALTPWGNVLFNDANGIKATAKRASIFIDSSSSNFSSSVPANRPPVANFQAGNYPSVFCGSPNVGAGKITASAIGSSDPDGDALTYSWVLAGGTGSPAYGYDVSFPSQRWQTYQLTLTVTDSKGASTSLTRTIAPFYIDCPSSSSRTSSSIIRTSSSSSIYDNSSSSIPTTSTSSSVRTSSSSSVSQTTKAQCSYQIQNQWGNGFTASIRIKNISTAVINGWDVNWQYSDGSKVTNLWNAMLSGANPYNAKNLGWNSSIQPGQTVEFGFQGSKPSGVASIPVVNGSICQ